MSGLNIGQLAFDLCELILQQAALVTVHLDKTLFYLSRSFFQYRPEISYGQANLTAGGRSRSIAYAYRSDDHTCYCCKDNHTTTVVFLPKPSPTVTQAFSHGPFP